MIRVNFIVEDRQCPTGKRPVKRRQIANLSTRCRPGSDLGFGPVAVIGK